MDKASKSKFKKNKTGRKKSLLSHLFKEVESDTKVPRVKCTFCDKTVSKIGTRLREHIEKCTKCNENIKNKYLMKSVNPVILEQLQNSVEISRESTPFRPSTPTNKFGIKPLHWSPSPANKPAKQLLFTQKSKINSFVDQITLSENVSILY